MSGGGQERGMRSGTLPPPLAVGLGEACAIANREMEFDLAHVTQLADRLISGIQAELDLVIRNGDAKQSYPCFKASSLLSVRFFPCVFRLCQSLVFMHRRREFAYGAKRRRALIWLGMYIGES